jgi:hypothetical protein
MIYILTVLLLTSNPAKIYKQEEFKDLDECLKWANFYNEYPFRVECKKEVKNGNDRDLGTDNSVMDRKPIKD